VLNIIENEDSNLLECDAVSLSEWLPVFQRTVASSPSSIERPIKNEFMGLSTLEGEDTTLFQNTTSNSACVVS
jgi:hypothetical protein